MGKSYEERAKEAVADGTWLDVAWSNLAKAKFVDLLYEHAGNADPQVAEDVARANNIRDGKPKSWIYFTKVALPHMGPWFVASLHNDWWHKHLRTPMREGIDLGGPVIDRLARSKEKDKIIPLLSASPYVEDRDAAAAYLAKAPEKYESYDTYTLRPLDQLQIAAGFARQGDPRGDDALTAALQQFADSHKRPDKSDGFAMLTAALRHRKGSEQAPQWLSLLMGCLDRGLDTFFTMATLAQGSLDDAIKDALTAWMEQRIDEEPQTRTMRVAAQAVLAQDKAVAKQLSAEDAKWLKEHLHPTRYGWPSTEQQAEALRLCAIVLFQLGSDDDRDWIAAQANSASLPLHNVADQAREALGMPPLDRVYIDEYTVESVENDKGAEGLLALLNDETTIWRDPIVKALIPLAEDDDAVRDQLFDWSVVAIEGQNNYKLVYADDVPSDVHYALRFLKNLPDEIKKERLSDSRSLWIQRECLGQETPYPERPKPSYQDSANVNVTQLGDSAFGVKTKVNGMALSPSGASLCVVGEQGNHILDTESGRITCDLSVRTWVYDCAFSQDGAAVITGIHGGYVLLFDPETGEKVAQFDGHRDSSSHVRSIALPVGTNDHRVATADEDGHLIVWDRETMEVLWQHDVKGCYTDVVFLPDDRLLAAYNTNPRRGTKRYQLRLIEADGQSSKNLKQESCVWTIALSDEGQIAFGGEGDEIIIGYLKGKTFKETGRLSLSKVTDLLWEGEDRLWACSQEGKLLCFSNVGDEPTAEEVGDLGGQLYALAKHQHTTYAAGMIHRIAVAEGMEVAPAAPVHGKRIVGILERTNDRVITADWDGKLLEWALPSGHAREVISLDATIEGIDLLEDGIAIAGTRNGLRSIDLDEGEIIQSTDEDGDDRVSIGGKLLAYMDGSQVEFARPSTLKANAEPSITVGYGGPESIALSPDGKRLVVGTHNGAVGLWQQSKALWWRQDHGSDRLEQGHPHRDVCSVAFSPDGTLVASGATDNVARVYNAEDGTQLLRVQCGFGLFNRLAFDHKSQRLAIPSSHRLTLVDITARSILWQLTTADFDGKQMECAAFLRDGSLVVGCATGEVFVITD